MFNIETLVSHGTIKALSFYIIFTKFFSRFEECWMIPLKFSRLFQGFFFPFFIFLFPVLVTSIKAVLILAKLCKNTKLLNECFIKHWTEPTAFRFKFYLFSFHEWHCMMIGLKQTTKFKPRIKLNHNMYNNDYWNSLQLWPGHIFLFLSFQGADYFTFEGAMGDFRKKNILHTDLKGKKSCKEIPEENNSCSEHKYLSWRLMVEKNLTSLFVTENNLSVTLWKKILTETNHLSLQLPLFQEQMIAPLSNWLFSSSP